MEKVFKSMEILAKWLRMIVLGLIVMVSMTLGACWIGQMTGHYPVGSLERGVSDEAIRSLVNDELIKQSAHRSDLLGITGPVRQIQAGELFWYPYGSRSGKVFLSILPSKDSAISRPIQLSTIYSIKLKAKGIVEIDQSPSRDEIHDTVELAMGSEQAVMSAAEDCLLALPVAAPATGCAWTDALEMVQFTNSDTILGLDRKWELFFSKTGKLPTAVGERIFIIIQAETLEISLISGVDEIEFARAALTSAGFDASQAELEVINPGNARKLPKGITHKLLRSHWVVRAIGVKGCTNPLWIPVEKNTMKVGEIFETPDPEAR